MGASWAVKSDPKMVALMGYETGSLKAVMMVHYRVELTAAM